MGADQGGVQDVPGVLQHAGGREARDGLSGRSQHLFLLDGYAFPTSRFLEVEVRAEWEMELTVLLAF